MRPVKTQGCNVDLHKPDNMTDEQCFSMPAERGTTQDGLPYFITAWMPNVDDVKAINRGEPVYLQVISNAHPPVSLFTVNENNEINE